jgi:hypothetical protein
MSIAYPVTPNVIGYHALTILQGQCELVNNSRYHVYVTLGFFARPDDVIAQSVARIPPFQRRTFRVNVRQSTPHLSFVASSTPYSFPQTIAGSQDLVRISESGDPKVIAAGDQEFDGLAADYVVIAGGRVRADQYGLFVLDDSARAAFAVAGEPVTWDGHTLIPGDVVIGDYFSGAQGMWWDANQGELNVKGQLNVTGGTGWQIAQLGGSWIVLDHTSFQTVDAFAVMNDGQILTIADEIYTTTTAYPYLVLVVIGGNPHPIYFLASPNGDATTQRPLGIFLPNPIVGEKGSLMLHQGRVSAGSGILAVDQLSAISADLGSITAGLVTGATIRTDADVIPDVQLDASGIQIQADAAGWLRWRSSAGVTASLASEDVIPGLTDKLLYLTTNPDGLNPGGNIQVAALGPGKSAYASFNVLSRNSSNDTASLGVVDSAASSTLIGVRREKIFLGKNVINPANFQGVAVGGAPYRTPGETLDVAGDIRTWDNAGLQRRADGWWSVTSHFESAPAWLTWAGTPFAGTPAVVDMTTYKSLLLMYHTTNAVEFFGYRALSAGGTRLVVLRLAPTLAAYSGVRLDDGTNNTFVELRFQVGSTSGLFNLISRWRMAGGAITTTTHLTNLVCHWYTVGLRHTANNDGPALIFMGAEIPLQWAFIGLTMGAAWTSTRAGFIFQQGSIGSNPNQGFLADWIYVTA